MSAKGAVFEIKNPLKIIFGHSAGIVAVAKISDALQKGGVMHDVPDLMNDRDAAYVIDIPSTLSPEGLRLGGEFVKTIAGMGGSFAGPDAPTLNQYARLSAAKTGAPQNFTRH